ncbi:MAG: class I SAM-dependent methyltransferase [Chthoniobacterales bacterium]|nr:class I SAM-dependent methyltransferase [Chthoniobacterales bacterium]
MSAAADNPSKATRYPDNMGVVRYPADGNRIFAGLEDNSFWYRHRNKVILECLTGTDLRLEGRFLEVGAGNGFVARAIMSATHLDVACLEPDPEGAQAIRERGIEQVICAPFREDAVAPASVSVMGMFDVLEHAPDELAFLKLANRTLTPGGCLLVTVPAYNWLWSIEDEHDGHVRRYSLRGLERALQEAGFIVGYATYFFVLLPLPIFLLRTIPSRLRLGNKKSAGSYAAQRAEQATRDHAGPRAVSKTLANSMFAWEMALIRRRKVLPFGGSIAALALKP